jgi:DNA-binding MarR family transcriptional regulator
MKTKASLAYIKFLHLIQAVNALPQFPSLDPVEERLLNYFASAWYSGKKLTVLETMRASPDISPSTVHRRLKTLHKKGLINLDVDQVDNRIKYIVHTDLTNRYFSYLGKCLSNASET